jgi:ferredoxin-NADP reductase
LNESDLSTIEVRLSAVRYAARDINLHDLCRPDGRALPAAEPGAHVDLHLPNGLVRQYSLVAPDPSPTTYTLGVKRDPHSRGGSQYVFDNLKVGQLLKISPPRNNFPLREDSAHTILIAGGIGITPIWAMLQHQQASQRHFELHFSCRSRTEMPFIETLQSIPAVTLHFDQEANGRFLDIAAIVRGAPASAHLYCCGPAPMLDAFKAATLDWPSTQVHVEYFSAQALPAQTGGFEVQLARSGKTIVVAPGQTILNAIRQAGLDASSSCEEGICGACETRVISGIPDHRDSVLSDEERAANKSMMICCSGCKGDKLVLDL